MTEEHDESFGVIPLEYSSGDWRVFLIQHKPGGYWGFPKGHAERGETPRQAALRELKEETNLQVVRYIQDEPILEHYRFVTKGRQISKRVLYFIAEVSGEVSLQKEEISGGLWLPFPDAIAKATHQEGKEILRKVEKILSNR